MQTQTGVPDAQLDMIVQTTPAKPVLEPEERRVEVEIIEIREIFAQHAGMYGGSSGGTRFSVLHRRNDDGKIMLLSFDYTYSALAHLRGGSRCTFVYPQNESKIRKMEIEVDWESELTTRTKQPESAAIDE